MRSKQLILLLVLIGIQALFCSIRADEELTPAQQRIRTELFNFVKEEGFSPRIDESDNSVTFKKEGVTYWITVDDSGPFYLELHRAGLDCEDADREVVWKAVNEANKKIRSAKAMLLDSSVSFAIEIYCHSVEEFKYIFYKCMKALDAAKNKVSAYYDEYSEELSSAPFQIRSVSIANTEQDGRLITSYGSKIYSYKTKYITPKLYVKLQSPGTYDIYVKFYTPTGLSTAADGSSPSGYSYKYTVSMLSGADFYPLSGWGGKDAGHWKAGDYRLEFYYQDELIGKTTFTIY